MIVQLAGLSFHTVSPSRFELLSVRDDVGTGDKVSIEFTGDGWAIVYQQPNRLPIWRRFESRDAAASLIASRQL